MANFLLTTDYKKKLREADARHGARSLRLVGPYLGMNKKAKHVCRQCGHEWEVKPANLIHSLQNCPGCSPKGKKVIPRREYLPALKRKHPDFRFRVVLEKGREIVQVQCKNGHIWSPFLGNILKGTGCPECAGLMPTAEAFLRRAVAKYGDRFDYGKVKYQGSQKPIRIICKRHGSFTETPFRHINLRQGGCRECGRQSTVSAHQYTTESFVALARQIHGNRFDYSQVRYKDCYSKVTIVCKKHGPWKAAPYNHLNASCGCPRCKTIISRPHQKLSDVLSRNGIEHENNVKSIIPGELDIYVPEKKIAIEINGVYWHSDKFMKNDRYHYEKASACRKQGIKLYQFWDLEITTKWPIVCSMLRSALGRAKRLYARDLTVGLLQNAKEWFDANHLQGGLLGGITYVLQDENGTVFCAMSFSKDRFGRHQWEMTRFANKIGYVVVGGASRLFTAFLREHYPKSVVSYADLRHSFGNLYRTLGFSFSHRSRPNYQYVRGLQRLSRYAAQKHRLPRLIENFDPNKSEAQNMKDAGFSKLYDAGNLVFVWKQV